MPSKVDKKQMLGPREPRQQRSRYKVRLILEATQQLLEKADLAELTTNAIAASAGVSIGTLYQFFPNKEAIFDALANREMAEMSAAVMATMEDPAITFTEDRIAAVVRVVAASYGGRHRAHRLVMAHSLNRGSERLAPLLTQLTSHLEHERSVGAKRRPLHPAEAFVITHAFAGVLRAMTRDSETAPSQEKIAHALARLVVRFIA